MNQKIKGVGTVYPPVQVHLPSKEETVACTALFLSQAITFYKLRSLL